MALTVRTRSLVDVLYDSLRTRILTGEIAAGEAVTELSVARTYDVARPSAKAALERLIHGGLLRRQANRTARVPILGVDDIRDLYYSRARLERTVLADLARARRLPSEVRAAHADFLDAARSRSITDIVQADIAFHTALMTASKSARIVRMYGAVIGEVHLCMAQVQSHRLLAPTVIAEEHATILSAIESGRSAAAAARITEHLDRACRELIAHLESGSGES